MKFFFALLLFSPSLLATEAPIERIAVFPFQVDAAYAEAAKEAWWALREEVVKNKRFFVATKDFLIRKDAYQARTELAPADAVILGRYLNANALVTVFLKGRKLSLFVYGGHRGLLIWKKTIILSSSFPIEKQLKKTVIHLMKNFLLLAPYHGFVTKSSFRKRAVYWEKEAPHVEVFLGNTENIKLGEKVEIVSLKPINFEPLFLGGGQIEILGLGKVVKINAHSVVVEIVQKEKGLEIKEKALVRFPGFLKNLQESLFLKNQVTQKIGSYIVKNKITKQDKKKEEKKTLITSLSFLFTIALVLILL